MNKIKAVIADDEVLARERIKNLLLKEKNIEIIAECKNGRETINAIKNEKPDLLLLDVQMPELDGFAVLKKLNGINIPVIIFVTAYDQYALRAFDVHAIDYLLKPFDQERFSKALSRAVKIIEEKNIFEQNKKVLELLNGMAKEDKYIDRLIIKATGRVLFIRTDEIYTIEAEGNYLNINLGKECHLMRESLNNIQKKLDPQKFFRIHRSYIVNINYIKEMKPWFKGEYKIILKNGTEILSGKSYRDGLDMILQKY